MIQTITQTSFKALSPDPRLNLHEWSIDEFELPPSAGIGGLIDFSLIPHIPPLLRKLSWSDPLQRLDIIKGTQLAFSTMSIILVFGNIKLTPCNILMMFSKDSAARNWVTGNIESLMKTNPHLKGLISEKYDKHGNSNKQLKDYNGGIAKFLGGKAPDNWREFPAKVVIIDDIDGLPMDIGATAHEPGEGSPILLGTNRTNAQFGVYKIYISGTPKHEHNSNIWNAYKETNKMLFMVPCPKCGHLMHFCDWDDMKFKYDKTSYIVDQDFKPYIECFNKECKNDGKRTRVYEDDKFEICNKGIYQATAPQSNPLHEGVMVPSQYSLLGLTWLDMCLEFLAARKQQKKGDPSAMITFRNTKLGLPWKKKAGFRIAHSELFRQREDYTKVPEQAVLLTSGIDIQDNRIEITVVGYNQKEHRYFIEHDILGGDTSIPYTNEGSVYIKLKDKLNQTFENEFGVQQPIMASAMDMGHMSKVASPFLKHLQEEGYTIFGVFGKGGPSSIFIRQNPTTNKYGADMHQVNVDLGKQLTYNQLKLPVKDRIIHFGKHSSFSEMYFRQMTVEYPQKKVMKNGTERIEWVKPEHARNEPFDTANYSLAALDLYTDGDPVEWEELEESNKSGYFFQDVDNMGFSVVDSGITV